MKQEEVLNLFEETGALLNGHFELRSGLHSNRFFQCAHLLQHPRISARLCEALATKIKTELQALEVDTVIAPAMGIPEGAPSMLNRREGPRGRFRRCILRFLEKLPQCVIWPEMAAPGAVS